MNPSVTASPDPEPEPAPTPVRMVIPVNSGPIDTGIRIPLKRVTLEEYHRLQREDEAERQQREAERQQREAEYRARLAAAEGDDETSAHLRLLPTEVLVRMIVELMAALNGERQEKTELRQRMEELVRLLHRRQPDEWSAHQPALFPELHPNALQGTEAARSDGEASLPANPADDPASDSTEKPRKKTKKPHGRRRLEELLLNLPVDRVEHKLTEAERVCPCCGKQRIKISEQTTQQVDFQPARLIRIEHAQFTYSCPHCPEHIVTAPKPPQPIDRGLPGPALLAAVVTHKCDEHQPLYRQELSLWRCGLFLSRSTLCDWMASAADLLRPLVERMKHHVFGSKVIQTDSTPVRMLVRGSDTTQTAHLWPYLGDMDHPYVIFDFSTDRTNEHPRAFLKNYTGYVLADASSGYDCLFKPGSEHPKIEVGCWAHTERYYETARDSDNKVLACQALGFIGALFDIERRARDSKLSVDEVLALRQQQSVPILNDFKNWLDATAKDMLPKSPLAAAVNYTLNQWQALNRYTEAGFLPIDNNATELTNKIIARGRLNWLFVGSPKGGGTAAVLFSIIATCRRLQMDPYPYLCDLFKLLPTRDRKPLPPERLDELLPDRWLASHPEARYPPERRDNTPRRRRKKRRNRVPP